MLLEGLQTKLMAYAGRKRESQLSSQEEMKNSCSEVANEVGKQRRRKVSSGLFGGFEAIVFFCWNLYDSFPILFFRAANYLLAVFCNRLTSLEAPAAVVAVDW